MQTPDQMDAAADLGARTDRADEVGAALRAATGTTGRLGVAFSGGVDSSVLLALAVRALGAARVVAVLGVSPSLAADERLAAHAVAAFVGVPVVEVETQEGERAAYRANGPDRCYHCKDELFTRIGERSSPARPAGRRLRRERRRRAAAGPARARAAGEHGVLRPLAEAGLTRPPYGRSPGRWSCPAPTSRPRPAWPPGSRTTRSSTRRSSRQIESAEAGLRVLGFADCRVRHHGDVARVELAVADLVPRRHRAAARRRCWPPSRGRVPLRGARPRRDPVRGVHAAARGGRGVAEPVDDTRGELAEFAELDHDRATRRGYPEAVYCEGKSPDQVGGGRRARSPTDGTAVALFTRAADEHAAPCSTCCRTRATSRRRGCSPGRPSRRRRPGAGSSWWPPAPRTCRWRRGRADGGVPGPGDRTGRRRRGGRPAPGLARLDTLRAARVVVVSAGMDGALPGVVAGLCRAPVVAVPTSVGYGAAFGGHRRAADDAERRARPGSAVVNIDNGYGAGHLAAQIAAP